LALVALVALGLGLGLEVVPATAQTTTTQAPPHPVTGRLLDAHGQPVAHQPVVLNENRGIASDAFGMLAFTFSLGLSCIEGFDPCRNSGAARVDTDAVGRFTFDVAAVQKARGRSQGVVLLAGDAQKDGSLAVTLNPGLGGELGDLSLWDPALKVTTAVVDGNDGMRLKWTAPPSADSRTKVVGSITNGPRTQARRPGELARFSTFGIHGDLAVDPRGLEDAPASLALIAGFHRPRANQNPRIDWVSPPASLVGAGRPLSRGAACTLDPPSAIQGCRLTDGDLLTAITPPPRNATVDLGKPTAAAIVAVRPIAGYDAQVSVDGTNWKSLASARSAGVWDAALFAADGPAWRYVRVMPSTTAGATPPPFQPAEVSVWPPPRSGNPGTAGGATTGESGDNPVVGQRPPQPERHHWHRAWLVALAIVLLAVGLVGAGVAIGRWRRR
jgi:hypothetical protein